MPSAKYYIDVKNKKIPIIVRNYNNSNKVKIYFKGNILNISKPSMMKYNELMAFIKKNELAIYNEYLKILSPEDDSIKHWNTGEKILYKGEEYTVIRETKKEEPTQINLEESKKQLKIKVPYWFDEETIKTVVDDGIKELFRNNTGALIQEKLPYWSKVTGIEYSSFKIADATTRFGSCVPKTKALHFSSRLIMLPEDKIDAVIVHELSHVIHKNHSKEFYELVKRYITNYDEIDMWLKQNSNLIMI